MRRRNEPQRTDDLEGLYRELYPSLVRFSQGIVGSRSDAEDAVHDAFVAAVRSEPADDPRPWLFRVTRNASIDLLRRRRATVPIEAIETGVNATPTVGPQASAELSEQLALIRSGLDALPERGRTAILLRELGGLRYSEISKVLDTTEGNVKVLIFRARTSLHELAEATELDCESVRMTLSAAADGEVGFVDRTRANLHVAHCHACRGFTDSVGTQRVAIAALVPLLVAPYAVGMTGGGGVFVGGGISGVKAAAAGILAAVTVGAGAGAVAVWHQAHVHPPAPHISALSAPTPAIAARGGDHEQAADGPTEPGDPQNEATDTAGHSDASSGDAGGTETEQTSSRSAQLASLTEPGDGQDTRPGSTTTQPTVFASGSKEASDN
jgi:RNA polymerase sigma-70 factor, ECF subfamily